MNSDGITKFPPILETKRTILRAHTIDDLDDCVALWSDPLVVKYISGRAFTKSETWARLLRYVGHWQIMGFSLWVVESKDTGEFLGEVGFFEHRRDTVPSYEGSPEAGWVFRPESHGKGLATETMKAALAWADQNLSHEKTVCLFDPANEVSLNVAKKLGYQNLQKVSYQDADAVMMERARAGF